MANKIHEGRNVRRFREMRELKQEALAHQLGSDWNQQKVSLLEQKETIEPAILEQLSGILNMPVEAFQKMDDEQAVNIFSNVFQELKDNASGINYNCNLNFNPLDKVLELFERLLESEREKTQLMKDILEKMK